MKIEHIKVLCKNSFKDKVGSIYAYYIKDEVYEANLEKYDTSDGHDLSLVTIWIRDMTGTFGSRFLIHADNYDNYDFWANYSSYFYDINRLSRVQKLERINNVEGR